MNIVTFCIGTIVFSYATAIPQLINLYKEAADQGYIITRKVSIKGLLALCTPVLNLSIVSLLTVASYVFKNEKIDFLKDKNIIKEMAFYEKNSYAKNPSAKNAYRISNENDELFTNIMTYYMNYFDEYKFGKIVFKLGKNKSDIKIIGSSGPWNNLSIDEQKDKIFNVIGDCDSFVSILAKISLNNVEVNNMQDKYLKRENELISPINRNKISNNFKQKVQKTIDDSKNIEFLDRMRGILLEPRDKRTIKEPQLVNKKQYKKDYK